MADAYHVAINLLKINYITEVYFFVFLGQGFGREARKVGQRAEEVEEESSERNSFMITLCQRMLLVACYGLYLKL